MEKLSVLVDKLKDNRKGCEEKCIDLTGITFNVGDNGEIGLVDQSHKYWFKTDPENPKDSKVTHAPKQFCKLIGVPFSFFIKNPEHMMKGLVKTWLPALKPDKAALLAKIRRTPLADNYIIRALLPAEYTNISDSEIMGLVQEAAGESFEVQFAIGQDRDDLLLHVRLLSKESFSAIGENCRTGFSVICSELGVVPLTVDTLLYREDSETSMIASYSGVSFFESDYVGMQQDEIKSVFPKLVERLSSQLNDIKTRIQASKEISETAVTLSEQLRNLRMKKGLSEKFHTLLLQEVAGEGGKWDRWSFANKVALIAKEFPADKRIRIERVAGELMGLTFEKA